MRHTRLELLLAGLLAVTPIAAQEATEREAERQQTDVTIQELETPIVLDYVTIDSLDGLTRYTESQLSDALGENLSIDIIYTDSGLADQTVSEINSALHLLQYPAPSGARYSSLMNESLRDFIQQYNITYADEQVQINSYLPFGVSREHDEMISEMLLKAIAEGNVVQEAQVELVPVEQQVVTEPQQPIQQEQRQENRQDVAYIPTECDKTEFESLKPYIDPQAAYNLDDVLSLYPLGISYIPCTDYGSLWNLLGLSEGYNPQTHARSVAEYQRVHDLEISYQLVDIVPYLNFENLVQESHQTIVEEHTSDKEYLRKLSWLLRREDPLDSISTANSSHERHIVEFTNHLNLDRSFMLNDEVREAIDTQLTYNVAVALGYIETEQIAGTNLYQIGNDDFFTLQNLQAYTRLVSKEDLDVSEPSNGTSLLSTLYRRRSLDQERLVPDHEEGQVEMNHERYRVGPDNAY